MTDHPIGSFVRGLRTSRGLSQSQLAQVAGVPQPNISAIERGHRTPSADTLLRIVVACGYELAGVAGPRVVHCDLPKAGWFSDEDLPPRDPGDPPDQPPALALDATAEDRLAVINAVFGTASALLAAP